MAPATAAAAATPLLLPLTAEKARNALPYVAEGRAAAATIGTPTATVNVDARTLAAVVASGSGEGLARHPLPLPSEKKDPPLSNNDDSNAFTFPPQPPEPSPPHPELLTYPSFRSANSKAQAEADEKLRPRKKRAVIFATLLALIVGGAVTIGLVLGLRSAKGSAGNEDLDAAVPANSSATQTSTTADPSRWSSTESQLTSLRAQAPPTGSTAGPNSASRQPSLSLPSASSLDSPTASSSNTLTSGPLVLPSPTSSTDATAPASNPPTTPTTSRSTNGKEEIGFTRTTSASSAPTPTPPPPPSLFQIFVNITSSCMVSHEGTNYMWGTACETAPSAGSIQLFSGRQNAPWVHKASGLCMVILDSDGFPGLVPCTGGIEQMWTIKDDVLYDGNGKCSTKPKGLETFIIGCARFALLFS